MYSYEKTIISGLKTFFGRGFCLHFNRSGNNLTYRAPWAERQSFRHLQRNKHDLLVEKLLSWSVLLFQVLSVTIGRHQRISQHLSKRPYLPQDAIMKLQILHLPVISTSPCLIDTHNSQSNKFGQKLMEECQLSGTMKTFGPAIGWTVQEVLSSLMRVDWPTGSTWSHLINKGLGNYVVTKTYTSATTRINNRCAYRQVLKAFSSVLIWRISSLYTK